ncbi:MAG: type II toxin-antitoxin system RelE/ParE family toxin [Deltaproteobacteria bacterium]|nr:type II toxin-antitoxin system RelE/ParE family toxin [Deltaproteobacteria bacterium]
MVIWTNPAKADLKSIHDFIASNSKYYAKKVTRDIVEKTDTLNKFPMIGRIVPETDNEKIREIFAYSYRIIYEIKPDCICILGIVHGKQELSPTHLYTVQEQGGHK